MEVTTEDKEFTVTLKDGTKIKVMGKVITTEDGFDENGNPKISKEIKVPAMVVGATPGEVKKGEYRGSSNINL